MGKNANLRRQRKAERSGLAIAKGKICHFSFDDASLSHLIEIVINSTPGFVDAFLALDKTVELGHFYHYVKSIAPQKDGEHEKFFNSIVGSRYWHDFAMVCTQEKNNELILIMQSEKDSVNFVAVNFDKFISCFPEDDNGYQNLIQWMPRIEQRRKEETYLSGCFAILDKFHNMDSLWYGLEFCD